MALTSAFLWPSADTLSAFRSLYTVQSTAQHSTAQQQQQQQREQSYAGVTVQNDASEARRRNFRPFRTAAATGNALSASEEVNFRARALAGRGRRRDFELFGRGSENNEYIRDFMLINRTD